MLRAHAHLVESRLGRREAAAVLAVAVHRPLERDVERDAGRASDLRQHARAVQLEVRPVPDVRRDDDGFTGPHAVARRAHIHLARHAGDQPAQDLAPERLVREVLQRDVRVELPLPRVLDGQRDDVAAAVALVREDDGVVTAVDRRARQQRRRAGLEPAHAVDRRDGRQLLPALA